LNPTSNGKDAFNDQDSYKGPYHLKMQLKKLIMNPYWVLMINVLALGKMMVGYL
jgi:hypothetical protein